MLRQCNEPQWISNSDCYSLVFTEKCVQNYFLCAYHLRREGLTTSSAKRQDYSKPKRVTWFEEIFSGYAYGTKFSPGI